MLAEARGVGAMAEDLAAQVGLGEPQQAARSSKRSVGVAQAARRAQSAPAQAPRRPIEQRSIVLRTGREGTIGAWETGDS